MSNWIFCNWCSIFVCALSYQNLAEIPSSVVETKSLVLKNDPGNATLEGVNFYIQAAQVMSLAMAVLFRPLQTVQQRLYQSLALPFDLGLIVGNSSSWKNPGSL